MRPVAERGRRLWGLAGLAVAATLAIPGGWLITTAGVNHALGLHRDLTRVITDSRPVTTLDLQSAGQPVQVMAGPVHSIRITETISYYRQGGGVPVARPSVSNGILTLIEPACVCSVAFVVTVPPGTGVAADTQGAPITVSGIAAANLDSGGGPVQATGVTGPLVVSTEDGALMLNDLTGPVQADTDGGPLLAQGIDSATVTVNTGGGEARIGFAAAPEGVFVSTFGGPAELTLPGGPYKLTALSYGGPESIGIRADPSASRSVTVTTGGGSLRIEPPQNPTG